MTPIAETYICILAVGAVARMSAAAERRKWIDSAESSYGLGTGFLAARVLGVD